jgi:hypothetical protein
VQSWDAHSGQIGAFAGASIANGKVTLPLSLESWATKLVVISGSPGRMASN